MAILFLFFFLYFYLFPFHTSYILLWCIEVTLRAVILILFPVPMAKLSRFPCFICLLRFFFFFFDKYLIFIKSMLVPCISRLIILLFVFKSWMNIECIRCFPCTYWNNRKIFFLYFIVCWIILDDFWVLN